MEKYEIDTWCTFIKKIYEKNLSNFEVLKSLLKVFILKINNLFINFKA